MAKTLADLQNDVRKNVATGIQTVIDEIGDMKAKDFHAVEGLAGYLNRLVALVEVLNKGNDVHIRLQDEGKYDDRSNKTVYYTYATVEIPAKAKDNTATS